MKFASYKSQGLPGFGVQVRDGIVDIPALFSELGIAGAPIDLLDLIRRGPEGLSGVKAALARGGPTYGAALRSRPQLEFLPAIPNPPKFFCVGRNYAEHARETGLEMSPIPIMFSRFNKTLIGDGAKILRPKVSNELDWEGELAVVIGRPHEGQIALDDAMSHVFGYTAFNDVTVRNYQFRTTQYLAGKNFRTSGPLGPVIVTADELPDPHAVRIETRVSGKVMQSDTTASMHFKIPFIINHLSEFIDLEAGDVIAMGTPAGVGFKRKPPVFLQPGDVVEIELSGIGTLTNTVAESP